MGVSTADNCRRFHCLRQMSAATGRGRRGRRALVGCSHRRYARGELALDRRAELLQQGQPAQAARSLAVTEAVQAFRADAGVRGWTVDSQRLIGLGRDVLGVEQEYRAVTATRPSSPRRHRG